MTLGPWRGPRPESARPSTRVGADALGPGPNRRAATAQREPTWPVRGASGTLRRSRQRGYHDVARTGCQHLNKCKYKYARGSSYSPPTRCHWYWHARTGHAQAAPCKPSGSHVLYKKLLTHIKTWGLQWCVGACQCTSRWAPSGEADSGATSPSRALGRTTSATAGPTSGRPASCRLLRLPGAPSRPGRWLG